MPRLDLINAEAMPKNNNLLNQWPMVFFKKQSAIV